MRIDKLLWFLRLAKTRERAQAWIGEGHIRLNGRRVERQAQGVVPGDILVLPTGGGVRIIELAAIPTRRGPAAEAQSCYRVLDESRAFPIAATANIALQEGEPPP